MARYALSFLMTSLITSAIILVILGFNVLFSKVLTAKLRYAVWLVVLAGLIIPLRPVIGDGLVTVPLPATVQAQPDKTPKAAEPLPEADSAQESTAAGFTLSLIMMCLPVWGVVAAIIFAYHIWRYIRFIRIIRRWGAPVKDEKVLSALRAVQAEKGLSNKKINLKICSFVSSSMLTGFFRPVILLPEKPFEEDELELIFRHELIHYTRRDLLVKLLSVIAVSIHWFNPIVYRLCSAIQTDGEASCDEAVLQDASMENRQFYAEVIIGMIGGKNTAGTMLSTCFYGGKSSIKKRLDSIMDTTRKMKKPAVIVLVAVAALAIFSGSVFAFSNYQPEITETASSSPSSEEQAPLSTAAPALSDSQSSPSPSPSLPDSEITAERAKEIALAIAGGGTVTECKLDYENDRQVYEIEIIYENTKHEMDVDAISGVISDYSMEAVKGSSGSETGYDDDHDNDDYHDD